MADKTKLISELRQRIARVTPLPEEPDFHTKEETLIRFLKSRDWKVEAATKMLTDSIEYRRQIRPQTLACSWCHNRPGFHSMRQVGHDEAGRPVIYSSFVQAATHKNVTEDSVTHVTYLTENAKRTMGPGVSTWVFIVDCTGMTLGACNPKLGYGMSQLLSNHYPERLGLMVCVNHSPVFHGVWQAMKQFLHPNTVAKVTMVRTKPKMAQVFSELFNAELSAWLQEEIALNKLKPLPKTQLEFWKPPPEDDDEIHDPRGCPSYVAKYVEGYKKFLPTNCVSQQLENVTLSPENTDLPVKYKAASSPDKATTTTPGVLLRVHKPHPNMVDQLTGHLLERVAVSKEEERERQEARSMVEKEEEKASHMEAADEEDLACDLDIPSDLQIPASALAVGASS